MTRSPIKLCGPCRDYTPHKTLFSDGITHTNQCERCGKINSYDMAAAAKKARLVSAGRKKYLAGITA